jgi:hypothetical protein
MPSIVEIWLPSCGTKKLFITPDEVSRKSSRRIVALLGL